MLRQIRILHALERMNPGGVETWLLNVLKHIDFARYSIHICTFGRDPGLYAPAVEALGARILRCPRSGDLWGFRRCFLRVLREGEYDVVHSHVTLFSGMILRWAAAESVPMRIAHSHTSRDNKRNTPVRSFYRHLMKRWIRRYATHGLAASRPAAAYLFGENWPTDSRYRVLHYGINLQAFQEAVHRDEVRRELEIPLDAPVVGHVGNFVTAKNHRFLLQIAAEVLKRRPDVYFVLVGDGPLRREIQAAARTGGLLGNIRFVGRRTDVPRLMQGAMDAFVFPSLWEGLPVALLEAQAAGLACIASAAITNEANLLPRRVTFLPLSEGPVAWAAATIDVLSGSTNQTESALRAVAQTDFSIERSGLRLSTVYAEAG